MIKYPKIIGCAAAAMMAYTTSVHADTISGTIAFTGVFEPAAGGSRDLSTANNPINILSWDIVASPTGSFQDAQRKSFTSSVTLNGPSAGTPGFFDPPSFLNPLWAITVGSEPGKITTYTFTAESFETVVARSDVNIIAGTGTITDGVTTSPGTYNLSFNASRDGQNASFSWNGTSGTTTGVPDGGTTGLLLSATVSGLVLIRRRMS